MSKENSVVVSVRIPVDVLNEINKWVDDSPVKISRSAAIVYLISKGINAEEKFYSQDEVERELGVNKEYSE